MLVFFEFLLERMLTFGTFNVKFSDLTGHSDRRVALGTVKKAGNLPVSEPDGNMIDLPFPLLGQTIVRCVLPLTLHNIFGKHTEKYDNTENKSQESKNGAMEKYVYHSFKKPDVNQKLIQRVRAVSALHKLLKSLL